MRVGVDRPFYRVSRWLTLSLGLMLLSACASTWSAKVTTYEHWPQDAYMSTYYIPLPKNTENQLEFELVADTVRVAMGAVGLVEGDNSSRLVVSFNYGNPETTEWVERFADPYFSGYYPNTTIWGGVNNYRWNGGFFYDPRLVSVPITIYKNTLNIVIKDKYNNLNEIYNVTVISKSETDNIISVMPYLAKAAFTDFPGINGQVKYIKIKRNP